MKSLTIHRYLTPCCITVILLLMLAGTEWYGAVKKPRPVQDSAIALFFGLQDTDWIESDDDGKKKQNNGLADTYRDADPYQHQIKSSIQLTRATLLSQFVFSDHNPRSPPLFSS